MKRILSIVLILAMVSSYGCASIVSGTKQNVSIQSNPEGASVTINGVERGNTPLNLELERKSRHQIILNKPGYIEEMRYTKRGYNWWSFGGSLLFSVLEVIVDFMTGAIYTIEPKEVNVAMTAK